MRLQEKLDQCKKGFLASGMATPEILATMQRSTTALRSPDVLARVLKPGDRIPSFTLPNQDGQQVSSSALLSRGPLVISFFRGVW